MTTLSVDHDLYTKVSEAALSQGKSVESFVKDALLRAVVDSSVRMESRNGIQVVVVPEGTPAITSAVVRETIEEEVF